MKPVPTDTVGFLIFDVARLLRREFDKALNAAGLGLSPAEARVLAYGTRHPDLRQTDLAERMNIEPMTLVGFLDRLEAKGLVERVPDPTDRRGKQVRLLPEARPLVGRIMEIAETARFMAMGQLSETEVEQVTGVLMRMRENLVEAGKEPVS